MTATGQTTKAPPTPKENNVAKKLTAGRKAFPIKVLGLPPAQGKARKQLYPGMQVAANPGQLQPLSSMAR